MDIITWATHLPLETSRDRSRRGSVGVNSGHPAHPASAFIAFTGSEEESMHRPFTRLTRVASAGSVCALSVALACDSDRVAAPAEPTTPSFVAKPGAPGAASDRLLFMVRLEPLSGSRSRGMLQIEIVGGYITAKLHANGLVPLQNIPQHIHVNPTCNPGGGILLNLDANLTVAGEGPGVGAAYPLSSQAGVVKYYASRSLASLLQAVNTYRGAGLTSVSDLLAWLDLEDRNAHMHVPFGPPFPAVNCGEVEPIN